jgi:hypothetical protein
MNRYHLLALRLASSDTTTPRKFIEIMHQILETANDRPSRDRACSAIEDAIRHAERTLELIRYTRNDMSRHLGNGAEKFNRNIHTHGLANMPPQ